MYIRREQIGTVYHRNITVEYGDNTMDRVVNYVGNLNLGPTEMDIHLLHRDYLAHHPNPDTALYASNWIETSLKRLLKSPMDEPTHFISTTSLDTIHGGDRLFGYACAVYKTHEQYRMNEPSSLRLIISMGLLGTHTAEIDLTNLTPPGDRISHPVYRTSYMPNDVYLAPAHSR